MCKYDNQDKIAYLQLIQEPIGRMSSIAAIIKGFCVTVVSGLVCAFYNDFNLKLLFISLVPVISFLSMDIYYLKLERKYRHLYDIVAKNEKEIDFSMRFAFSNKTAKARVFDCLLSFSIWGFYMIIILFLILILLLNVFR